MKYKLACTANPVALGIEDAKNGGWSMVRFLEHIADCPLCSKFASCAVDALGGELADVTGWFLRRKRTIGDLRKTLRKTKKREEEK